MLKFLVILFSVIYLGGILVRWVLRKWITNLTQQGGKPDEPLRKEGEVTINHNDKNSKKFNAGEGEYIDYEEVK